MRRKACGLVAAASALSLIGSGLAHADGVIVDGDAAVTGGQNQDIPLGDVCAGSTSTVATPVYITRLREGNTGVSDQENRFKNGDSVSVARNTVTGVSTKTAGGNVAIPADWDARADGAQAGPSNWALDVAVPSALGSFSRTVTFTATGINGRPGANSAALIRNDAVVISGRSIDCTPTPPPPPPPPADTTAPTLTLPANITQEATSAAGRLVNYTATANDAVDGAVTPSCSPASGSTFALGTSTVSCTATDAAGNTSDAGMFTVTIRDTTAPTLSNMPSDRTVEATSSNGAVVTYTNPTATDAVDASPTVTCTPASGSTFGLGGTTVSCTAQDAAGNTSARSTFVLTVADTTAPTGITFSTTGVQDGGSYLRNFVPAAPTCSATDLVTATPTCVVTGHKTIAGTHTLTATATDAAGNSSTATISYTVRTLTISAFRSPVDGGFVQNVVKGGSTVPLKFTVFDGVTERKDTAVVSKFGFIEVTCDLTAPSDEIEELSALSGTSLRYDTTQFIQNWKTPTGAGTCYQATVTTIDGSSQSALFKLK